MKILLITVQILFILRFHLELSNVSAFSEPASSIRKLTNPLVLPLKKLLPFVAQRFAAVIIAYVFTYVLLLLVNGGNPFSLVFKSLLWLLSSWLLFMQYGLLIYALTTWIQHPKLHPMSYFLHHVFEPVLRPLRPYVPPVAGMDFSPMVLFIGLSLVSSIFFSLVG